MSRRLNRCLLALGMSIICTGCYSLPSIRHSGTAAAQQSRASLHDPYADNDIGPEVVGGRPREFQKPLAEPVREQLYKNSWWAHP